MASIEIEIAPAGGQHNNDVFTSHWGDILLATSRTPFFESARKLLELGADPADLLTMRHAGSLRLSLRARVGTAAKLTVLETNGGPRFAPWHDLRSVWAKNATENVD
jgi:hypothetical protein